MKKNQQPELHFRRNKKGSPSWVQKFDLFSTPRKENEKITKFAYKEKGLLPQLTKMNPPSNCSESSFWKVESSNKMTELGFFEAKAFPRTWNQSLHNLDLFLCRYLCWKHHQNEGLKKKQENTLWWGMGEHSRERKRDKESRKWTGYWLEKAGYYLSYNVTHKSKREKASLILSHSLSAPLGKF